MYRRLLSARRQKDTRRSQMRREYMYLAPERRRNSRNRNGQWKEQGATNAQDFSEASPILSMVPAAFLLEPATQIWGSA
jgi:hypothetical protein